MTEELQFLHTASLVAM